MIQIVNGDGIVLYRHDADEEQTFLVASRASRIARWDTHVDSAAT